MELRSQKNFILKFNQYLKLDKPPCINYADLESLIKKKDQRANNPEKSSATKIGQHIPCRYSMPTIWAFDSIKDKLILYHGEDCMEKFWISLREHAANVIKFQKKKMLLITEEELT